MLPMRRVTGSLVTSAVATGLTLIVVSLLGVVFWLATLIVTAVLVAGSLLRRRV